MAVIHRMGISEQSTPPVEAVLRAVPDVLMQATVFAPVLATVR